MDATTMSSYLLLNSLFLGSLLLICWLRRVNVITPASLRTLAVVLLLTVIFDNLIIASGIVAYHHEHLLGIKIGLAPIEDFAYSIAAWLLIMLFWGHDA